MSCRVLVVEIVLRAVNVFCKFFFIIIIILCLARFLTFLRKSANKQHIPRKIIRTTIVSTWSYYNVPYNIFYIQHIVRAAHRYNILYHILWVCAAVGITRASYVFRMSARRVHVLCVCVEVVNPTRRLGGE